MNKQTEQQDTKQKGRNRAAKKKKRKETKKKRKEKQLTWQTWKSWKIKSRGTPGGEAQTWQGSPTKPRAPGRQTNQCSSLYIWSLADTFPSFGHTETQSNTFVLKMSLKGWLHFHIASCWRATKSVLPIQNVCKTITRTQNAHGSWWLEIWEGGTHLLRLCLL